MTRDDFHNVIQLVFEQAILMSSSRIGMAVVV